jgi:hypothetical protein
MTPYADENPGAMDQAEKCYRIKPVNGISLDNWITAILI